jgi:hypothetical protein
MRVSILRDFAQPPLTLVGTDAPHVGALLRELYAQVDTPFVQTSIWSTEMQPRLRRYPALLMPTPPALAGPPAPVC